MARKKSSDYQRELKRLRERFPHLKEIRAKKNFSAKDKAAISRAAYYARVAALPKAERPEKLKNYVVPSLRTLPEKEYIRTARKLSKFAPSLEKYKDARQLSPAQKAAIRRKMDLLRHTENVFALTPAQAKKLGKEALLGSGVNAIRLRNTGPNTKIRVRADGSLQVTSSGRKWFYIPTGSGEIELLQAAEKAFEQGAAQVHFWTVAGRVGTGSLDLEDFNFQLKSRYMQYLGASEGKTKKDGSDYADWLLGIAYTNDD